MALYGKVKIRKRKDGVVLLTIPKKIVNDSLFPFDVDKGERVSVYIQTIDGKRILRIEGN